MLPLVRRRQPRRRWVALAALAIVSAAACTHATSWLSPPLHPSHQVAMRSYLPAQSPGVRRVQTPVFAPAPKAIERVERAERVEPAPQPKRVIRAAPRPVRPPGFDPVLGF